MTKQEEREALKKIEKIIKAAGPDSYIGMAFAGCCEIAADNIENDFGESMQARVAAREKELREVKEMLYRVEKENERLQLAAERFEQKNNELRGQIKAERAERIPADLYKLVWLAIDSHIQQAESRIAECVENLVQFAAAPKDIAVAHALEALSKAHAKKAEYVELLERFDAYEPKEG